MSRVGSLSKCPDKNYCCLVFSKVETKITNATAAAAQSGTNKPKKPGKCALLTKVDGHSEEDGAISGGSMSEGVPPIFPSWPAISPWVRPTLLPPDTVQTSPIPQCLITPSGCRLRPSAPRVLWTSRLLLENRWLQTNSVREVGSRALSSAIQMPRTRCGRLFLSLSQLFPSRTIIH